MPTSSNSSEIIKFELWRKLFHLGALCIPLAYYFTQKLHMLTFMCIITTLVILIDVKRHDNTSIISSLTDKFFNSLFRINETNGTNKLSGASYMFLGFTLTMLVSNKNLGITAQLVLIIADTAAAIVGTKIGNKLANGKSLEGSVTFIAVAILVSLLSYFFIGFRTSITAIIISSTVAAVLEFNSRFIGINDNLTIPLSYALVTNLYNILT